ncbi:MAG: DUF4037 domain-containing protein [Chloroflexia bacterium]|nr:DUF4037 domain-containing protein [Chloroflexia bacterium]
MADRIGAGLATLPGVRAVVLGGSLVGPMVDPGSDVDLYVYADKPPPVAGRRLIAAGGRDVEIDNRFWETGDEWEDDASGLAIDVMYRESAWVEGELDRVLDEHRAAVGYSTAIWANVQAGIPLIDPSGWYGDLRRRASVPYPEPLRQAIVAKNLPLLRAARSAYRAQIVKAIARDDLVSVNHRVAALLASVFDILFALNRQPHPGEKRQVAMVEATCPVRPAGFGGDVLAVLGATSGGGSDLLRAIDRLITGMESLVADEAVSMDPDSGSRARQTVPAGPRDGDDA